MNVKIEKLIKQFAKLPRLGSRAAQRIVLALLQDKTGRAMNLANALIDATASIEPCPICGVLTDKEMGVCEFCRDGARANGQLCIVRDLSDVWTLEKSAVFHGKYHILGGVLSAIEGVTPEDLNIEKLISRVERENISEIILALPATVDGQITMHYISSLLKDKNIRVSTLAQGIPVGAELDYMDDGTIKLALDMRKRL